MKTKILLTAVSSFFILHSAIGQGALTPPGAPAPTMKTLTQIEPRTPISSVPFNITQPGSYYLTTNVTATVSNAIVISTSGVTLDLNGFTIASTVANAANGGTAILLAGTFTAGLSDITVFNGHIRGGVTNNGSGVFSGSGFANGIYYSGNQPVNVLVSKVSVSGCLAYGIYLNSGDVTVVESCTARTMGSYGIAASTIKGCAAVDCGSYAIFGYQVSDCRGESVVSGTGINAVTAQNCYGQSSGGGYGINANTAQNCYGQSSGNGYGISATTTQNCYGQSSGFGNGISATTALNCYGYSGSGSGINADNAQNCNGQSASSDGIHCTATAENCHGISNSGTGLYAFRSAVSCYGESSGISGVGLYVQTGVTFASFGYNSTSTGLGLQAYVATGCYGQNGSGTSETINNKYNMP